MCSNYTKTQLSQSQHTCKQKATIYVNTLDCPTSQETGHPTLAYNFAKCWSIFKILSPSDSAVMK